jgi:hypothetical protein
MRITVLFCFTTEHYYALSQVADLKANIQILLWTSYWFSHFPIYFIATINPQ